MARFTDPSGSSLSGVVGFLLAMSKPIVTPAVRPSKNASEFSIYDKDRNFHAKYINFEIITNTMVAERFLSLKGFSLDTADSYMSNDIARYLKNVVYSLVDTSQTGTSKGSQAGLFKPVE
jgi:hypothetical protein